MTSIAQSFKTGVGADGLAWVKLIHPAGSTATIHLFGATVTSVTSATGRELLFTSAKGAMDGSAPIRGGIPICFPQFGTKALPGITPGKVLPMHGFARRFPWRPVAQTVLGSAADAACVLTLELSPADLTGTEGAAVRAAWPNNFLLTYTVALRGGGTGGADAGDCSLFSARLEVRNPGASAVNRTPSRAVEGIAAARRAAQVAVALGSGGGGGDCKAWLCQGLLHTYLAVADSSRVAVRGLGGAPVIDRLATPPVLGREQDGAAGRRIDSETEQLYPGLDPEQLVLVCSDGAAQAVAVGRAVSAGA